MQATNQNDLETRVRDALTAMVVAGCFKPLAGRPDGLPWRTHMGRIVSEGEAAHPYLGAIQSTAEEFIFAAGSQADFHNGVRWPLDSEGARDMFHIYRLQGEDAGYFAIDAGDPAFVVLSRALSAPVLRHETRRLGAVMTLLGERLGSKRGYPSGEEVEQFIRSNRRNGKPTEVEPADAQTETRPAI